MRGFLTGLTTSLAVLALASPASAVCANEDLVPTAENVELVREAIICLHNEERAKTGHAQLGAHWRLTTAAQLHAQDMVAQGYFAHQAPSDVDPFDRMRRVGYINRQMVWNAGETIARAPAPAATPRNLLDAWMKSTTQRLTLLAPDFRDIGVGIAFSAPAGQVADAPPTVIYTVNYGWRVAERALRRCLRRAELKQQTVPQRRVMRARCHGLD